MKKLFFLLIFFLFPIPIFAWDLTGSILLEGRYFFDAGLYANQKKWGISPALDPELVHTWDNDRQTFTAKVFFRYDAVDDNRTHFDIRQLDWTKSTAKWEFRIGIRKVFWGVIESVHLVDVINQTDLIENFDGEAKLGQPMINIARVAKMGTFDLFVMSYFRKRTHPGHDGRFRFATAIIDDNSTYESSWDQAQIDVALRWFHTIKNLDIGLYHFWGTNRDPRFLPGTLTSGEAILKPHYDLMHQTGLDAQLTIGQWLWKFEGISRWSDPSHYYATAVGFEYTFSNVNQSGADIGVLIEHLYDSRGTTSSPFENDIFSGIRIALNDENDVTFLSGVIFDLDTEAKFFNLEASRRFGDHIQASFETRWFIDSPASDFLFDLRNDSYSQLEIAYFF